MSDLESLLARLVEHKFHFVLVGGYAAVAHGCTLLTQDVDVCCEMSFDNLARLAAALEGCHPVHRMTPTRLPLHITPEFCDGLQNLYLATTMGQLDCLGEIAGIGDFAAALGGSEEVELPFGLCRILTLDSLIAAKAATNRPRDRDARLQLESIREQTATSDKRTE